MFVVVALLLVALAWATTPRRVTPAVLQDRGRPFFPDFTDPNAATSLEVVEFDEQTSVAKPFKVLNRDGRVWIGRRPDAPAEPEGPGAWWQMPQGCSERQRERSGALRGARSVG